MTQLPTQEYFPYIYRAKEYANLGIAKYSKEDMQYKTRIPNPVHSLRILDSNTGVHQVTQVHSSQEAVHREGAWKCILHIPLTYHTDPIRRAPTIA